MNFGNYDLLAIDPGNTQSGYVRIRDGRILQSGVLPNTFMLAAIDGFMDCMLNIEYPVDRSYLDMREENAKIVERRIKRVAIEMIQNMGMIVGREVFETIFWAGRFAERAHMHNVEAQLCYRPKVKAHVCGAAHAKDANVRAAMCARWGAPGTKKAPGPTYSVKTHAWAALAVASYAIDNPPENRNVA